jgi:hypothetical protein
MQKLGMGIVILVIGVIIGLSAGIYISMYQTPSIEEPIKVTIQRIEYTTSDHSILKIDLLNNVPEKNLDGWITVTQNQKQWTNKVTWHYTGYGETEITCDYINETENFRVIYMENSTREWAPYLDRIIEWNEVTLPPINFMATEQLTITSVTFGPANTTIICEVLNTGPSDIIIADAGVTGNGVTGASVASTTIGEGTSGTITITVTGAWSATHLYKIEHLLCPR